MRQLLAAVLLAVRTGCSATSDDVDHDDPVAFAGMVRATWDLKKAKEEAPPAGRAAKRTRFEFWGEAEFLLTQGRGDQRLAPGDEIELEGMDFRGPVEVDSEVTHVRVHYVLRPRVWFSEGFGLEGIGGAAFSGANTSLEGGGLSEDFFDWYLGPKLGGQVNLRPARPLTFYTRATFSFGLGFGDVDIVGGDADLELGATVDPSDQVFLFAGWRWAELIMLRGDGESNLYADLSGPFVGIGVRF